jgi:GR25 family glycosyltransferase involved in LPS biosynthesis
MEEITQTWLSRAKTAISSREITSLRLESNRKRVKNEARNKLLADGRMTERRRKAKNVLPVSSAELKLSQSKAFILHLASAVQRRAQVDRLRAALPFASEIVDAADGANLSQQEIDRVYARQLYRPRYSFALTRPEIGVFLSHRAAWRRIVDEGLDYAAIFEDDAEIDPAGFAEVCGFMAESRDDWSYVLAPAPQTSIAGTVVQQKNGVALIRPGNPPLRAIAQFVSNDAARKLLAATEKFDRPIDTFLQMSWVTGVELLALRPSAVRDASQDIGGSTIKRKQLSFAQRVHHELARPLYRAQVRAWHAFAKKTGK